MLHTGVGLCILAGTFNLNLIKDIGLLLELFELFVRIAGHFQRIKSIKSLKVMNTFPQYGYPRQPGLSLVKDQLSK